MNILFDLDTRRLSLNAIGNTTSEPEKAPGVIDARLQFLRAGVPERLPVGHDIKVGIKVDSSGDLLSGGGSEWERPATEGGWYIGTLNLNTGAVAALWASQDDSIKSVPVMMEAMWSPASANQWRISDSVPMTLEMALMTGSEDDPSNATDPSAYLTIVAALATFVRFDAAQSLTNDEKAQSLANIGAAASVHSHSISDVTGLQTALDAKATTAALSSHTGNTSNPHSVTAAQVGLGEVDNTSDADKPISDATQTALDGKAATVHTHSISDVTGLQTALDGKAASVHTHSISDVTGLQTALDGKATTSALTSHTGNTSNPHSVTAAQVGLGNVDDTSDADKPISDATQTALDGKAATVHTHSISNVTGLQTALDGKAASVHTHSISDVTGLQTALDAKATTSALSSHTGNTSNPHSVTAAQVGLGEVDNTSDADKPISDATQTALDGKAATVHTHSISNVTGLQTALDGKAASVHSHSISDVTGLQTALDGKATTAALSSHTGNTSNPHSVTAAQVGLGEVDNTSDADKPISDATQTALDGKAATVHTHSISDVTGLQDDIDDLDGRVEALESGGGGGSISDPGVIYIRSDGDDSTGDGSPGAPFATLQHAIDHPSNYTLFDVGAGYFGPGDFSARSGYVKVTLRGSAGENGTFIEYLIYRGAGYIEMHLSAMKVGDLLANGATPGVAGYNMQVFATADVIAYNANATGADGEGGTSEMVGGNGGAGGTLTLSGPLRILSVVSVAPGQGGSDGGQGVGSAGSAGYLAVQRGASIPVPTSGDAVVSGAYIAGVFYGNSYP